MNKQFTSIYVLTPIITFCSIQYKHKLQCCPDKQRNHIQSVRCIQWWRQPDIPLGQRRGRFQLVITYTTGFGDSTSLRGIQLFLLRHHGWRAVPERNEIWDQCDAWERSTTSIQPNTTSSLHNASSSYDNWRWRRTESGSKFFKERSRRDARWNGLDMFGVAEFGFDGCVKCLLLIILWRF